MSQSIALVTGAGGEMGHLLIPTLRAQGIDVIALDLVKLPESIREQCVETTEASILDGDVLDDLFRRHAPAYVFHLAAVLSRKAEIDPEATPAAQAQMHLEASFGAQIGKAIEPAIAPLGYDWKIGAGLIASFAAREIIVATLAQIYAVGDSEEFEGLRGALKADVDPRTGEPVFSLPVALSLLVFFVFALQCTSTIAVMARETGGWRWPIFALTYMLALAWSGAFVTYRVSSLFL